MMALSDATCVVVLSQAEAALLTDLLLLLETTDERLTREHQEFRYTLVSELRYPIPTVTTLPRAGAGRHQDTAHPNAPRANAISEGKDA